MSNHSGATYDANELLALPLEDLLKRATSIRDHTYGTRITYSPKVFIPLTMLCRDKCGYCTFAQPPARLDHPYLEPDEVLELARHGATQGCHEALFTLGERPELRYPVAKQWLADNSRRNDYQTWMLTIMGQHSDCTCFKWKL